MDSRGTAAASGAYRRDEPPDINIPAVTYLNRERHCPGESTHDPIESGPVSKWRMKDRMKTGCVAIVLCLNFDVDPPDLVRLPEMSRMECWIEPSSMPPKRAVETVGKSLQAQYERWQSRAKYKLLLDPPAEDVKKLCHACRKVAKNERVLFHYNGHGVPRPTGNGEIWLFNQTFTQYIPLSVVQLEEWLAFPSIFVFDCSAAGKIAEALTNDRQDWGQPAPLMKDMIILAACEANESLPQHRDLPADVFTSCLTTPIRTALRWFVPRSSYKSKLETDIYERIPGRQSDRKTMLGELNWIFTAITDTIAWDVLPRDLFQRLFRQDLLVASLFRNFLLAERIMRSLNCTPRSHPKLPQTHEHHMWSAWDRAAENCLSQLSRSRDEEFQPSPFFSEQLLAFQEWLKYATETSYPPLQLPIVLQVLLSQSHRHRALELLGQFLDKGSWAVDLALSVGIFPYVLKLLQTSAPDLREFLVFIWTKILAWDKSCQVDLVKDNGHMYFIKYLRSEDLNAGHSMEYKTMALFVLSVIVDKHPKGQEACLVAGLLDDLQRYLREARDRSLDRSFIRWVCLCLAKLWDGQYEVQGSAFENDILSLMVPLLEDPEPEVRATAVYALGTLLSVNKDDLDGLTDDAAEVEERMRKEREIAHRISPLYFDGSIPVRRELGIAIMRLAHAHKPRFQLAAAAYMKPPLMPKQSLKGLHPSSSFPAITLPGALRPGRQSPRVVFQGTGGADLHIGAGIVQNSITAGLMHSRDPSSDPGRDGLGLQLVNPGSRVTQGGDQQSPDTKVMGSAPIRADHMRNLGEIPLSSAASPPNGTPPSPALHGSLGSDSSFHSDDVLRDSNSVGLRIAISDAARATDVEDRKIYVEATSAVCSLVRDPAPVISNTARQTLRILGAEPKDLEDASDRCVSGPGGLEKGSSRATHPSGPSNMPLNTSIHRSFSWIGPTGIASPLKPMNSSGTSGYFTGPSGMRRVISSVDIFPFPTRDGSNLPLRVSAEIPGVMASSSPAREMLQRQGPGSVPSFNFGGQFINGGAMSPAGSSFSLGLGERDDPQDIRESPWFQWCCKSFRKPKLYGDETDASTNIKKNKENAQQFIKEWRNAMCASVRCSYEPILYADVETDSRALVVHPFDDILCSADSHGRISIWNYVDGETIQTFQNQTSAPGEKGVSKLCFVNELDSDCLLLAGSSDGCVRVWRNFKEAGSEHLAAAWQVLKRHRPGARPGNGAVIDWQQKWGQLFASGDTSHLYIWALQEERMAKEIQTNANEAVTALAASQTSCNDCIAGCEDGSIRIFDVRQKRPVCEIKAHTSRVVGIGYLPNKESQMVSAAASGELKFFDIRTGVTSEMKKPSPMAVTTIEAHAGGNLSALAVHRHAPVIATGSSDRSIKVFGLDGRTIAKPRYHLSVVGHKIGPVTCLGFHPYKLKLAMGAKDQYISIFGDPKNLDC